MQKAKTLFQNEVCIFFICPVTKIPAKSGPDGKGYRVKVTKEWVRQAAPVLVITLKIVQLAMTAYGIPFPLPTLPFDLSADAFLGKRNEGKRREGKSRYFVCILICRHPTLDLNSKRSPPRTSHCFHDRNDESAVFQARKSQKCANLGGFSLEVQGCIKKIPEFKSRVGCCCKLISMQATVRGGKGREGKKFESRECHLRHEEGYHAVPRID